MNREERQTPINPHNGRSFTELGPDKTCRFYTVQYDKAQNTARSGIQNIHSERMASPMEIADNQFSQAVRSDSFAAML